MSSQAGLSLQKSSNFRHAGAIFENPQTPLFLLTGVSGLAHACLCVFVQGVCSFCWVGGMVGLLRGRVTGWGYLPGDSPILILQRGFHLHVPFKPCKLVAFSCEVVLIATSSVDQGHIHKGMSVNQPSGDLQTCCLQSADSLSSVGEKLPSEGRKGWLPKFRSGTTLGEVLTGEMLP